MPIPALNDYGLLPDGVHDCAVDEIQDFFGSAGPRQQVWQAFLGFLNWAATMPGPFDIYVDGSFVTSKAVPGDIDVAVDISGCDQISQNQWLGEYARDHATIKEQFSTDFYPFSNDWGHDFSLFFQYLRVDDAFARGAPDGIRKGILRLLQ